MSKFKPEQDCNSYHKIEQSLIILSLKHFLYSSFMQTLTGSTQLHLHASASATSVIFSKNLLRGKISFRMWFLDRILHKPTL